MRHVVVITAACLVGGSLFGVPASADDTATTLAVQSSAVRGFKSKVRTTVDGTVHKNRIRVFGGNPRIVLIQYSSDGSTWITHKRKRTKPNGRVKIKMPVAPDRNRWRVRVPKTVTHRAVKSPVKTFAVQQPESEPDAAPPASNPGSSIPSITESQIIASKAYARMYILETYGKDQAKSWAPQSLARNYINRLCQTINRHIYGMEMFALSRAVDVLFSLAQVDSDRVGMYGLSQGGLSATFLGALETRLKAVVSSAYFNERHEKQVVPSEHYGRFVDTSSEDHIYTHLAEFSDSDLASLVCPRCFFVEDGKKDGSVWYPLAEKAFAEVKAIYDRLGIPDRCGICIHEEGHEIEPVADVAGIKAVQFLDRWLRT